MSKQNCVAAVVTVIIFTFFLGKWAGTEHRENVASSNFNLPGGDAFARLSDARVEVRQTASREIMNRHMHDVARLAEIVRADRHVHQACDRVLAAQILGKWREASEVPTLLDYCTTKTLVTGGPRRDFDWKEYPFGGAIVEMGVVALDPALAEIAIRSEAMTGDEVRVYAHLIVSLCGNSKEDALSAIRKAEETFPESKNLHPVRMQIEHFMDFKKNVQRQRAEPSA